MARTILVADDSLAVHRAVEKSLSRRDDEIRLAASGDEALRLFESDRPDLALIDVHMPGVSGYEVARQIKSSSPDVPVLLLVGTFEPYDEEMAQRSEADGHLMKPFDGDRLLERIDELTGFVPSAPPPAASEPEVEPEIEAHPEEAEERRPAEQPVEASTDSDSSGEVGAAAVALSGADVERIARRVVELLSSDVVERVAREVLPEIAEAVVRRRIEELEREEE